MHLPSFSPIGLIRFYDVRLIDTFVIDLTSIFTPRLFFLLQPQFLLVIVRYDVPFVLVSFLKVVSKIIVLSLDRSALLYIYLDHLLLLLDLSLYFKLYISQSRVLLLIFALPSLLELYISNCRIDSLNFLVMLDIGA